MIFKTDVIFLSAKNLITTSFKIHIFMEGLLDSEEVLLNY